MDSFRDFLRKVLGPEAHKENETNLFDEPPKSNWRLLLDCGILDLVRTEQAFNLLKLMPDISNGLEVTPELNASFVEALEAIRKTYEMRQREAKNLIFWLNAYMKECSNYGETREEKRPETQGNPTESL